MMKDVLQNCKKKQKQKQNKKQNKNNNQNSRVSRESFFPSTLNDALMVKYTT